MTAVQKSHPSPIPCIFQNIDTELDAWLTFLSSDAPSDIIKLVTAYPKFQEYYNDISKFRKNPKELINMFSEALAIMDRNTELYMMTDVVLNYSLTTT